MFNTINLPGTADEDRIVADSFSGIDESISQLIISALLEKLLEGDEVAIWKSHNPKNKNKDLQNLNFTS